MAIALGVTIVVAIISTGIVGTDSVVSVVRSVIDVVGPDVIVFLDPVVDVGGVEGVTGDEKSGVVDLAAIVDGTVLVVLGVSDNAEADLFSTALVVAIDDC